MIVPIQDNATITVIWEHDPAVDRSATVTDHEEVQATDDDGEPLLEEDGSPKMVKREIQVPCILRYADRVRARDYGSWRETLVMRPGQRPTEFVIGIVPPTELTRIEDECGFGTERIQVRSLQWEVFKAALRDIRNGPTKEAKTRTGTRLIVPKVEMGSVERVDPVWLEEVFGGSLLRVARYIGEIAWTWNSLGDQDAKN